MFRILRLSGTIYIDVEQTTESLKRISHESVHPIENKSRLVA